MLHGEPAAAVCQLSEGRPHYPATHQNHRGLAELFCRAGCGGYLFLFGHLE